MRQVWHQVDGKLVPGPATPRGDARSRGVMIIPDIEPYRLPGTNKWIRSRSEHRAYLKARGAEEVGNEKAAFMAMGKPPEPTQQEMEREIRTAIEQCRAGHGAKPGVIPSEVAESLDLTQVEKV